MSLHRVILDTETTGLHLHEGGRVWEAAFDVVGHPDPRFDGEWLFTWPTVSLRDASPEALRVSRAYERLAVFDEPPGDRVVHVKGPRDAVEGEYEWVSQTVAAGLIARLVSGATVIGCRPEFDVAFLGDYLRRCGEQWTAHYHTIDVAQCTVYALGWGLSAVPYRSDDLAAALGVPKAAAWERHTAVGDVRWVGRWVTALEERCAVIRAAAPASEVTR